MFVSQIESGNQVQSGKRAVYRDSNGHIQSMWSSGSGGWTTNDLTVVTQDDMELVNGVAVQVPLAVGVPSGFACDFMNMECVVYRDQSSHIQMLRWDEVNQWSNIDLTQAAGAPLAAGDPRGYVFDSQGTMHVVYRDNSGNIQELWWNGSWNNNNLTQAANAPPASGDPFGYMFDAQGTEHVVYADINGHIQELWWNGNWNNNDLTKATNAPAAGGNPVGYVFNFQGSEHVVYRDVNGHIQELWWNGGWNNNDLTKDANAPLAAFGPSITGYAYEVQGSQHVVYQDVSGNIQELWWSGNWNNNNLTQATSAPMASTPGGPSGYMFAAQDSQHVVYRDVDGHVQELSWQVVAISSGSSAN
jgi:hypothetical protein